MTVSKTITLLLYVLLICSMPVFAHTDVDSYAGLLSNIIAVVIVVLSIIIYFLINSRKERNQHNNK